jgi:hypothetical protein
MNGACRELRLQASLDECDVFRMRADCRPL